MAALPLVRSGQLNLSTGPAEEPITRAEAKKHLRVEHTEDDDYIDSLIAVARRSAEMYTGRAFITQTWELLLDCFPAYGAGIQIPYPPLQSVSSVEYYDTSGVLQTLASSKYQVDTKSFFGRLLLEPNESYPLTETGRVNAVVITFVAGYGGASAVPEYVKHAIKLMLSDFYNERESFITGSIVSKLPRSAEALLNQERVHTF